MGDSRMQGAGLGSTSVRCTGPRCVTRKLPAVDVIEEGVDVRQWALWVDAVLNTVCEERIREKHPGARPTLD